MPMFSMFFSFINILTCAMKINIFNVYIVQIRKLDDLKRFFTLSLGYFPFFLHSILFRVFSYVVIVIFLFTWSWIPLAVIFFSNLVIGYAFLSDIHYDKSIKDRYKSMTTKNQGHGIWKKIQASPDEDAPVWLNSFLGLFIPSCYIMGALPSVLDKLSPEERVKVFKEQSRFQKKIISLQAVVANLVIMISLGVIFYIVDYTNFYYTSNRLSFIDFYICIALLVFQGLISFLFLGELDVLRRFRLSDIYNSKSSSLICKLFVTLFICLLVLVPPFAAYFCSTYFNLPNVYVITKKVCNNDTNINIDITKSMLINTKFSGFPLQAKAAPECQTQPGHLAIVLKHCIEDNARLNDLDSLEKVEAHFANATGLLLLTGEDKRSAAKPWNFDLMKKVTSFPVLAIHPQDFSRVLSGINETIHLRKITSF